MKRYTAKNRNDDAVRLYSDDTFTLALGDPDDERYGSTETTPELLREVFDDAAIRELMLQVGADSQEYAKLQEALTDRE